MKKEKVLRLSIADLGHWVRIYYSGIGSRDCILLNFDNKEVDIFDMEERSVFTVQRNQVICIGPYVEIPKF